MKKVIAAVVCAAAIMIAAPAFPEEPRQVLIPVLGTTMDKVRKGTVAHVILTFENRRDEGGLAVVFKSSPGQFSPRTQAAIEAAIYRAAHAMGVSPKSWTVVLSLPYAGITLYGDSCTAMAAISVMILASGHDIPPDQVITGTIMPDGRIGPVGAVPLKIAAASEAHLQRVLVPEENDPTEKDWETPFLMHVSPVGTVKKAFSIFTENEKGDAR